MRFLAHATMSFVVALLLVEVAQAQTDRLPRAILRTITTAPTVAPRLEFRNRRRDSLGMVPAGDVAHRVAFVPPGPVRFSHPTESSHSIEFSHPTDSCTLDQCYFDRADPWASYCQESRGRQSYWQRDIFLSWLSFLRPTCRTTTPDSTECQIDAAHSDNSHDHHAGHGLAIGGVFDLFSFFMRPESSDTQGDEYFAATITPDQRRSLDHGESSLPRNSLPTKTRGLSVSTGSPRTNDGGYDSYDCDEAHESDDGCDGGCGPDLFTLFLGGRRSANDCDHCDRHHEEATDHADDTEDTTPVDPVKIMLPTNTLPSRGEPDRF